MARIQLEHITKKYKDTVAVNDLSLDIADNEFFVLFGPAGAGKTTTLKTIAGIEMPQEGLVKIGGEIVNLIEPMYRNVSMVFENYALYPQFSVYDNIAFPLRSKLHRKDEAEIKTQIDKVLAMLKINGFEERKPSQLSNGQKQRVAIGRCLVRDPSVFLMDEPLAHLDAKLRHEMRGELKEMQKNFNTTTIYVTHDYMEAMSLADRIAILNLGQIVQLGSPLQMYYTPINEFVARLFGEPEINIFPAHFLVDDGEAKLVTLEQDVPIPVTKDVTEILKAESSPELDMGIRGVDISFTFSAPKGGEGENWVPGTVYAFEPIGNKVIMTCDVKGQQIRVTAPNDTQADLDQAVWIKFNMANALYFRRESTEFITRSGIERYK
ncbi:MAG: ABC transporter ATP-binding protein [Spirochaetaceae bacterium]|jgi:multiple sugar transport system ATP-binding protein|nr:ABC transporter ATP-binding protein [Spirochaetaceae bacterium]